MRTVILVSALLSALVLSGFAGRHTYGSREVKASGITKTIAPAVTPFTAVVISFPLNADISVEEGATASIQAEGDENILSYLKTRVTGNTLEVYCDNNVSFRGDYQVSAHIRLPRLVAVSLVGAANAAINGNVKGDKFELQISGAATAHIGNMSVHRFVSDISGSGNVEVADGNADRADFEISGSGRVQAYALKANEVSASISGSGTSEITAVQKLWADVSGSGTIKYQGQPELMRGDVSGSGGLYHQQ